MDVLACATEELSLDWSDESRKSQSSKLDERNVSGGEKIPFFPDPHHEISRSWKQSFSYRLTNAVATDFTNVFGSLEEGYAAAEVFTEDPRPIRVRVYILNGHLGPGRVPIYYFGSQVFLTLCVLPKSIGEHRNCQRSASDLHVYVTCSL